MQEHIVVPRRFLRNYPQVMQHPFADLTDPIGNVFQTEVRSHGNEIWFEGGFDMMRGTHELEGTVYIHFTHIEGSSYNIRIFHDNEVEIEYANPVPQHLNVEHQLAWTSQLTTPLCTGNQALVIYISFSLCMYLFYY